MGMGSIATSGMQAAMSDMEVISNNIANVGTKGFKKSIANFADIFPSGSFSAGKQVGLGVDLASVQQDFNPGNPSQSNVKSNMSIAGSGFFVMRDGNTGLVSYSRNGQFDFNPAVGYFTVGNQRLQGFAAVNGSIPSGSSPADLFIDTTPIPASATATVTQGNVNLNSNESVPSVTPFSSSNSSSYNFVSNATVYDSLGNANTLTLYYVKDSTLNTWNVYASVGGTVINSSTPGTLTFNSNGTLASSTDLDALSFSPTSGAVSPQALEVDMTGVTQNAGPNAPGNFSWDGSQAGTYKDYTVDIDGLVTIKYNNGTSTVVGQVALAEFASPQNLQYIGGSSWTSTSNSGTAMISPTNSQKNITPASLEESNVDMAQELVNLINAQSTFQANAQVQQTYSAVMQTVTKL